MSERSGHRWMDKDVEDLTREEAIDALLTAMQMLADSDAAHKRTLDVWSLARGKRAHLVNFADIDWTRAVEANVKIAEKRTSNEPIRWELPPK